MAYDRQPESSPAAVTVLPTMMIKALMTIAILRTTTSHDTV